MCAIAGILGRRDVNQAALAAMMESMSHRGPDGSGLWKSDDGKSALGHRRLAILDTTDAGAQPMPSGDGMAVITFNGEIYNYVELANRLKQEGVRFNSQCDTEVLLAAWQRWGENCLSHLNGMFAFAILDRRRNILFCARDRYGEKPFLFRHTDDFFAFASEYKALLPLMGGRPEIDETRLLRFLVSPRQGLDDGRQTVFPGIQQLLPGEMATLDLSSLSLSISRYWNIEAGSADASLSDDDAAEQFRGLLTDSVRLRLRSDVPVGSCLSGGLDSGSIVCLSRALIGDETDYHVFTGEFPGAATDESVLAAGLADHVGAIRHTTRPTAAGLMDDLEDFLWFNELPVGSTSQYAQWCVFRQAKQDNVTVLLDGQGADEVLGGYEQYFEAYLSSLPSGPAREAERQAIHQRYPLALDDRAAAWKKRIPVSWRRWIAGRTGKGSNTLYGLADDAADAVMRSSPETKIPLLATALGRALYEDSFQAHLPTLLRYGDRNSMAHSREVRLPFCDHRIAEFCFSLPPHLLMGDAETKRLLRRAMKGILPENIRTRWNKQGFLPPQSAWFRNDLLPLAEETISSRVFAERGYWNVPWWKSCLDRFKSGEAVLASTLWQPVIAEAWQAHFADRVALLPRHKALR